MSSDEVTPRAIKRVAYFREHVLPVYIQKGWRKALEEWAWYIDEINPEDKDRVRMYQDCIGSLFMLATELNSIRERLENEIKEMREVSLKAGSTSSELAGKLAHGTFVDEAFEEEIAKLKVWEDETRIRKREAEVHSTSKGTGVPTGLHVELWNKEHIQNLFGSEGTLNWGGPGKDEADKGTAPKPPF